MSDLDRYTLAFSEQDFNHLFRYLRSNSAALFHDKSIRAQVIKRRQEAFGIERKFEGPLPHSIDLTVPYNLAHAKSGLESNVIRLIRPLSVIDPCYEKSAEMKVRWIVANDIAEQVRAKVSNGMLAMSRYRLLLGVATLPSFVTDNLRRREEAEAE